MGYYSDVGLAITGHARELLDDAILKIRDDYKPVTDFLINRSYLKEDKASGAQAYVWEGIKWYENNDDYPEVRFFQNFLKTLDCSDYLFIRIGESFDDVEIDGTWWNNPFGMHIAREIKLAKHVLG